MVAAAVAQNQALVASKVAARPARAQRTVRVSAVQQSEPAAPAAPLRLLAAGLAAAALSVATPAEAGVVLVQPQVKNFVTGSNPAPKAAAAQKASGGAKREESSSSSGISFETFRPLVLPVALLAVAGGGVAAAKADPEFAELLSAEWSAKDSNSFGAGYETAPGLKDTPFFGGSNSNGAVPKKTGTIPKKAVAAIKKAGPGKKAVAIPKKNPLGSLFSRD